MNGAVQGLATTQAHPDLQRIGLEPNEKGDKLRTEISVDQVRRLSQWCSVASSLSTPPISKICAPQWASFV